MDTLEQFLGIPALEAMALAVLLAVATVFVGVVALFLGRGGMRRLLALFLNGNGKNLAERFTGLEQSVERGFREVNASLKELKDGQTGHSQEIALLFAKDKEVERRIDRVEDGGSSEVKQLKGLLSEAIAAMRE